MKIPLPGRRLKRFLPTRLFARAVLILVLPMIVLQLTTAYVFYERHWQSIERNMGAATAGDVAVLTHEYDRVQRLEGHEPALGHIRNLGRALGIGIEFNAGPDRTLRNAGRQQFPDLYASLSQRGLRPLLIQPFELNGDNYVRLRLAVADGALDYILGEKRLVSSTTYIFILWMAGSSLLLMAIAVLFLRNQIRPIVQLARAAEQFGLGHDVEGFTPKGASEIRRAASAFLLMADRIRRSVASRTEMLAGISHDLRTPLTRMKLEIEMAKMDTASRDAIATDIDEMRRMVDEYLDFARGDAGEPMTPLDIAALLRDMARAYRKQGQKVHLGECSEAVLMVRPHALRRALQNLIENAVRYGQVAFVSLEQSVAFVRIKVADHGPGIPEAEQENVFKPFTRLELSRNVATGGVGLGLSIARDIAQSHGGDIALENQRDAQGRITGLEVTLRLPREITRA